MVDWGVGRYERTAVDLAPVSEAVIARAAPGADQVVVDVACGTGNAALAAAARGATVIGVDAAARLLEVARERAAHDGVELELREGDLLSLPVADRTADLVVSVFGVIFAADPAAAVRELARIVKSDGRVLITAWIPSGPIDGMLAAINRLVAEATGRTPPPRFQWSDTEAVAGLAEGAGLALLTTDRAEVAIADVSLDAYMAAQREHPMSVAMRPLAERAGIAAQIEPAGAAVLREANESPDAFLVHSPYVVHELRPA